jgi:hypothetical protein
LNQRLRLEAFSAEMDARAVRTSNALAGMIRVDGIQADVSDPRLGTDGERDEADNLIVLQGNIDVLLRFRVTGGRQQLGLFGFSPCQGREQRRGRCPPWVNRSVRVT